MNAGAAYKRVLLKISGEALTGESEFGIDTAVLIRLGKELRQILENNIQVGMVIGGGNLFRGRTVSESGIDRVTGDHMGMLATLMNALAMREVFERHGIPTRVLSAIPMSGMVDHYDRRKAIHHLEEKRLVIFAGGTGNPLVTTDSAASLRAVEIGADILLKATNVDGVYSADPNQDKNAKLFKKLSYKEVLDKELAVMDLAAFCQCRDHHIPIRIFNIRKPGSIIDAANGDKIGTLVT